MDKERQMECEKERIFENTYSNSKRQEQENSFDNEGNAMSMSTIVRCYQNWLMIL